MVWSPPTIVCLLLVLFVGATAAGSGVALDAPQSVHAAPALARDVLDAGTALTVDIDGRLLAATLEPRPVLLPDSAVVHLSDDGETPIAPPALDVWRLAFAEAAWTGRLLASDADLMGFVLAPDGALWSLVDDSGRLVGVPVGPLNVGPFGLDGLEAPTEATDLAEEDARAPAAVLGEVLRLRLAMEIDFAYYWQVPDWADTVASIIAILDMIYEQIDVRVTLAWAGAWTVQDPYSSRRICTGGGDDKLVQFGDYWQANRGHVVRDAAHLGARAIDGNTIGCAWIRELGTSWAYGVNQFLAADYYSKEKALLRGAMLVAHELGHNFDGRHERSLGAYGLTGAASYPPPYTIMNPVAVDNLPRYSELNGYHAPTGAELDNAGAMRAYAEMRLPVD